MEKVKTEPNLLHCIKDILSNWQKRPRNSLDYLPKTGCPVTKETILAQQRIGWKAFLEGFLAVNWANQQQSYYSTLGSRRTGQRWAIGLSKKIWNLIHTLWNKRNLILHAHNKSESMNGSSHIKLACLIELDLGPAGLSTPYNSYFNYSAEDMISKKSSFHRHWLSIIRKAREASGHTYHDFISSDPAIRKWIGLL